MCFASTFFVHLSFNKQNAIHFSLVMEYNASERHISRKLGYQCEHAIKCRKVQKSGTGKCGGGTVMEKGYIQIYTGNGKGKTTAAFGLAVRALMSGKNVFVGQFVKDMEYNETKLQEYFDRITIRQLGRGCFLDRAPTAEDAEAARAGLKECCYAMSSGVYDVVILDEITIALRFGLFAVSDVVDALNAKAPGTEVVLTGRYAPQELIDMADLVTDMVEVKHYYNAGVLSRDGIDH